MKDKYDVIVIGGLSAGALTAKAGKSVLIVDQRPGPGGVCHSFERALDEDKIKVTGEKEVLERCSTMFESP